MKLGKLCRRDPACVAIGAPLSEVVSLMQHRHVGAVFVTESSNNGAIPVGIITDRDITGAQLAHAADLSGLSVASAMTRDVLVLSADISVADAVEQMRAKRVRRAPVVALGGRLVGIISTDDLLGHVARELSALARLVERQPTFEGWP
jgi:CBS domain-containing protein